MRLASGRGARLYEAREGLTCGPSSDSSSDSTGRRKRGADRESSNRFGCGREGASASLPRAGAVRQFVIFFSAEPGPPCRRGPEPSLLGCYPALLPAGFRTPSAASRLPFRFLASSCQSGSAAPVSDLRASAASFLFLTACGAGALLSGGKGGGGRPTAAARRRWKGGAAAAAA